MASNTFQIAGLSSGFDWMSMLDQLRSVEHRRIDLKSNTQKTYSSQLAQWQSVNSRLLSLKTAAEKLKNPEEFAVFHTSLTTDSAAVAGEDLLNVATDSNAASGSYTIKVTRLAKAQKLSSNPFTSKTAALGSTYAGEVLVNGKVVTITAGSTLMDVAGAVNKLNSGTDPSGVAASIVSYGANDYRLILTSDATGEDGISLLNGASGGLLQKFGWKDGQTTIKNSITNGVRSDRVTAANISMKSLLGLAIGEASTGGLTIDGTAVAVDLSTQSLTDIKDAINSAMSAAGKGAGIVASVVSETVDGITYYRLKIEGTQMIADEKNILNTLGIVHQGSGQIAAEDTEVSANSMTEDGAYITAASKLVDIDGYLGFAAGDHIQMTGTQTGGAAVNYTFNISAATTMSDLLTAIESQYGTNNGDAIAYLTADGKIRVEDVAGGGSLNVILADNIANGQIEFVSGDGAFGDGAARFREIVAGEDASIEIDGVAVTRKSNIIDDVIEGATLNLVKADSSVTLTLDIERDIDAVKQRISDFAGSYNSIMGYIAKQFSYDEETQKNGGVLFGDSTLSSIKSELATILTESVWGVNSQFASLSLVGIENNKDENGKWQLKIDETALNDHLQTNFNDVMALFVGQGVTTGNNLSYISHARDSQANNYTVHIDRAAVRGAETGIVDLSTGGAEETLNITQGGNTATIAITAGMTLDDIKNEINTELDAAYAKTIVGEQMLTGGGIPVTSSTLWSAIDGASLQDNDTISFSGTDRSGGLISGGYTIENSTTGKIQDLLSAVQAAFGNDVTAQVDSSGRFVMVDKSTGASDISLTITGPAGRGLDFGTIDVTAAADDGSQEGRYAMKITAKDDGNGHLVLQSDEYGDISFVVSTSGSSDRIVYADASNTTITSNGMVRATESTTWGDIYGADVSNGDTITVAGTDRNGNPLTPGTHSLTYTIADSDTDTIGNLLIRVENLYADAANITPTNVNAFMRDGKIYVEDTTAGGSLISLTLTANNEGGGNLDLGAFDRTTERGLGLGMISGTVTGQNVAGTIGGETAKGSGQTLTGIEGNPYTGGIVVRYSGTSNNTNAGTVKLTVGIAERFERVLYGMTDGIDGYVSFKQGSIEKRISDVGSQIKEMETRLEQRMAILVNRYTQMELALAKLQSQSNWLSGQLQSMFNK